MALKTGTIWHMSDLHLRAGVDTGAAIQRADVDGLDPTAFSVDARRALFTFVERQREEAEGLPDPRVANALVISGDLVHQSGWTDTVIVQGFLERLRKELQLPPERVVVIPGNHDVNWATARTKPSASRDEFMAVTSGYTRVNEHCSSVWFDDDGLAFLLADTVAHVGVPVNLGRVVTELCEAFPALAKKEVEQVLAGALAAEVPTIAPNAIAEQLQHIAASRTPEFAASGHLPMPSDNPRLPNDLLGFLVSHYPLLPCPYTNVEVKPFHLPVGAGPAKRVLSEAGVFVCLHGHQHVSWVHAEKTTYGNPDVRFCCVGAGSLTQDDKAFNIIRYALMTETGEARLAIQPVYIRAASVQAGEIKRFYIPPRVGIPARAVRLVERIYADAHVRGDKWYSDISTQGWRTDAAGKRVRKIPVVIQTDQAGPPTKIRAQPLTAGFHVSIDPKNPQDPGPGTRSSIRVVADNTTDRLSFAIREFNRFAYCSTVEEKARCYGGELAVPSLAYDEEAIVHVVRVPCERLEIYVCTPDVAPTLNDLRLVTYVETAKGALEEVKQLQAMTDHTLETWPEVKRVRLTVPRPMEGAAYGVAWKLPPRRVANDDTASNPAHRDALHRGIEQLRLKLLQGKKQAAVRAQLLAAWRPFEVSIRTRIATVCPGAEESAEITLVVPDQPLLTLEEYQAQYEKLLRPEVSLVPVLASFDHADKRYKAKITVGLGVAGVAYLTNQIIHYDSTKTPSQPQLNGDAPPSPYLALSVEGDELAKHSSLYAYPLVHPWLRGTPLGCVCVGSIEGDYHLQLEQELFNPALHEFLINLSRAGGIGRPFA
ncbi:MAG: metallophosphoesterase [Gemmatimonadaceae bacterium]|nr:metallophosphoesterase [Gemmatimonadaceae bacterium]